MFDQFSFFAAQICSLSQCNFMQLTRIYKRKCFDISVFLGTMSVSISIVNILRKAIAAPVVAGAVSLGSKIPLALPSDLDRWQIALLLYLYLYHFIIRYLWSAISNNLFKKSIYTAHHIASLPERNNFAQFNLLQSLRQAGVGGCIAGTLESGRGPSPKEGKGSATGGSLSCQYRLRVFVKHPKYRFYTF